MALIFSSSVIVLSIFIATAGSDPTTLTPVNLTRPVNKTYYEVRPHRSNEERQNSNGNLLTPTLHYSPSPHYYFGGRRTAPPTSASSPAPPRSSSTLLEPVIIHHSKKTVSPSATNRRPPYDNSISSSRTSASTCPSGECLSPVACRQHGGTVVTGKNDCYPPPLQCCQFHRSCSEVTSPHDKTTFFNSPSDKTSVNASSFCSLQFHTHKTTCAVRLSFLKFRLHRAYAAGTSAVKCPVDSFFVLNSAQEWNEPLCQAENHTAILYVNNGTVQDKLDAPLTFLVVSQSLSASWSIKIDQLDCSSTKPWTNEPRCGRQLMYEEDAVGESPDQQLTHSLIIKGQPAIAREFPWQISIQSNTPPYSHRCGGSVLNKNHILTASHCVTRNAYSPGNKLRIIAGTVSLNISNSSASDEEEESSFSTHSISSVIFHYHYSPHKSQLNDIAVIRLEEPLEYSSRVQPVCLPTSSSFKTGGLLGWVSGWGRTNETDKSAASRPTALQKLKVRILDDELCQALVKEEVKESLKRDIKEIELETVARMGRTHTQLCAQAPLSSAICFGDSGGPLVVVNEDDGTFTQVGIVSYGLGKCVTSRNPPGAYTRVSEYLNFIALATS